MKQSEQRRYFRITDTIGLSYRPAESEEEMQADAAQVEITAAHVLASIDRDLNRLANAIWAENPTVAKALGLINRKIEVLTDEIIGDDRPQSSEFEQTEVEVNISGCGMAFNSNNSLSVGQALELYITLKPSNTHLTIEGVVQSCDASSTENGKPYRVRIDFTEEETAAQEELIQHIVQRQFKDREPTEAAD